MSFTLEGIIIWLIVGAVAGWGASKLMHEPSHNLVRNIVIGIVGAVLGNAILSLLHVGAFIINWWITAIIVAVAGACLLIYLIRLLKK
ncbi:hypothetical protein AGMMS49959_12460 [Planctomycetales bacterium]|nr:hypothetical protein AGMMS49959_12460 [Planctomycetales bacterium]